MRVSSGSRLPIFALLAGAAALTLAALPAPAKEPKMKDLTDTVLSNRIMTKFARLLRMSDLASFLSSRGPFTLFVPTDSAFSRISPEIFAALQLPENKEVLQRIILFHVVNNQRLTAKDLLPLKTLLSCEGHPLPLRVNRAGYQIISKAKILRADTRCLNGLLHEIDTVLVPPGISLATLAAAPAVPPLAAESNADSAPASPTNDIPAAPSLAPTADTNDSVAPTNTAPVPATP